MTDGEEESEFSRRGFAYVVGGTLAATAASGWYLKDILNGIFEKRDEPGNFGESTSTPPGTPGDRPSDQTYEDWEDAIPAGCSLPQSYETAIEEEIDKYDELQSENLTEYVNTGRVKFEKDGTEGYMIIDEDDDGQYDHGRSIPGMCK
ncbi:hypothetical protein ACK3SF_00410 [Candidatus Nanosalina sp. VS9-1]|uniref:hypothetical protein n=1 Tax=Candidatus Nanosalina sp. VS9-1 TaxID=3388566 RepID=UPI0039E039CE